MGLIPKKRRGRKPDLRHKRTTEQVRTNMRYSDPLTKKTYRIIMVLDDHLDIEDEFTGESFVAHKSWVRDKEQLLSLKSEQNIARW